MEEQKKMELKFGITGFQLKVIAIITMLIDHIGYVCFPEVEVLRVIGRLAFPIFAFFIAEGAYYTSNIRKYEMRLLLFALISEVPFDMAFYGEWCYLDHQNVFFTLLAGLVIIDLQKNFNKIISSIAFVIIAVGCQLLHTDYGVYGVVLILMFYYLRDNQKIACGTTAGFNFICNIGKIQCFSALSSVLLLFYNGQRGRKMRWIFYLFYPAHLTVLAILKFYGITP